MDKLEFFRVASSACHRLYFLNDQDDTVGFGSAFYCAGHLITNNHVFNGPVFDKVRISRHGADPLEMSRKAFRRLLITGSREENQDYAALRIPELANPDGFSFAFGRSEEVQAGSPVAVFGYPFGVEHLSVHQGSISSIYKKRLATVFQIDASVNNGNSGGPLIDIASQTVVGIVSRKHTGLTDAFSEIKKYLQSDIRQVKNIRASGMQFLAFNVDPYEEREVNARRLLQLFLEVERTTNVGIGYAFSTADLQLELENMS